MAYDYSTRHETVPTFLHPNGLDLDPNPFITEWGLTLPGIISATLELDTLISYSKREVKEVIVPTPKQLERINLNIATGCWELKIYKDGADVYPEGSPQAGQSRARYGSMMVKGVLENPTDHLAHRVMYSIMRGGIPEKHHIDHLCRNAKCCYHRHLEAVSVKENTRRIHEARLRAMGQELLFY